MEHPGNYDRGAPQHIQPGQLLNTVPGAYEEIRKLKADNRKLQDLLKAKAKLQVFSVNVHDVISLDVFKESIVEQLRAVRHHSAFTKKLAHLVIEYDGDYHKPNHARYAAIGVLKNANQLWSKSDADTIGIKQWIYSAASIVAAVGFEAAVYTS